MPHDSLTISVPNSIFIEILAMLSPLSPVVREIPSVIVLGEYSFLGTAWRSHPT